MNLFGLSGIATAITSAALMIFIFSFGKTALQRKWGRFNFAIAIWGIGCYLISSATTETAALFAWKIAFSGAIFTAVLFCDTVWVFTGERNNRFLIFAYGQGFIALILVFSDGLVFNNLRFVFDSLYYNKANLFYIIIVLSWILVAAVAHTSLHSYSKNIKGVKKIQANYLMYASLIGFLGGGLSLLPAFGIDIYPFINFTIPLHAIVVSYAIFKYRFLDISVAITRTSIFIAVYSLVLGGPYAIAFGLQENLQALLGDSWWLVPLFTLTVLATAGPFVYLYIQQKAEEKIFQEQHRYQSTLRQASAGMGRIKDLSRLVNLIVHIVSRTVRLEHCAIYLFDNGDERYKLCANRSRAVRFIPPQEMKKTSFIVKSLRKIKGPVVYEEIKQQTQDYGDLKLARLEGEMQEYSAALIVPSFVDEKLIAVLILGRKVSGKLFSESDLSVFSILANQAALAIENAQFYVDMKKTHAQLFKAEKMATIGTMADGLSHQINNRLHALGFIAGDALDTIKLKKDAPMSDEIKEVMVDLEHALHRIEDNVAQGGEIVRGLLKYTRKGEEGFSAVELDKLVDAAIEMTQFKIKAGELKVLREYGNDVPLIKGNFTQLQEVFFNLIDNAYDAMMERKQELREEGYQPTIRITAASGSNGSLRVILQDNGIGIKSEDKNKLFTPFFTTKLSSKKGTGLGLYVIQKLIEENHEGRVEYSSKHKEGTKVTLRLLVAEN